MPTTRELLTRWEQVLRVLLSMDEHARINHFDMTSWGRKTECGTVACIAGHAALDPWFNERGWTAAFVGNKLAILHNKAEEYFGSHGFHNIMMALDSYHTSVLKTLEYVMQLRNKAQQEHDAAYAQKLRDYEYALDKAYRQHKKRPVKPAATLLF